MTGLKVYNETQRFTQWWIWVIHIFIISVASWVLIESFISDRTIDSRIDNFVYVLLFWLLLLFIPILFWIMRLETRIDRSGIYMKYVPFLSRTYKWEDIQSFEMINYGFVGGWGIRLGTKYGTVYNVKGNKGLYLILKNGKRVCIGTQKEHELESFIKDFK